MGKFVSKTRTALQYFISISRRHSSSSSTASDPSSSTLPEIKTVDVGSLNAQKPSLIGSIDQPPVSIDAKKVPKSALATDLCTPEIDFPSPPNPELCCGSGCPNCIWIQYAEEVINYVKHIPLHDGVEEQQKNLVRDALNQNVEDDNLRVYLQMEIQAKGF